MQTSVLGPTRRSRANTAGFTLIELLVVLVIAGILVSAVALSAMPNLASRLRQDAQRLSFLMQIAHDEAIVRNKPIALEANSLSYRFLERQENTWVALPGDDLLRERSFCCSGMLVSVTPLGVDNQPSPLRIVFGREPVGLVFRMTLRSDKESVHIEADGLGNFSVE